MITLKRLVYNQTYSDIFYYEHAIYWAGLYFIHCPMQYNRKKAEKANDHRERKDARRRTLSSIR